MRRRIRDVSLGFCLLVDCWMRIRTLVVRRNVGFHLVGVVEAGSLMFVSMGLMHGTTHIHCYQGFLAHHVLVSTLKLVNPD
jgi:hypothetical protein